MNTNVYEIVFAGLAIVLALLALIGGARRGLLPELLALGSILLGALLAGEWGGLWGTDLAETVSLGGSGVSRFLVWLALLLVPVALIGYLAGWLLPAVRPARWWYRAGGALLGLVNGATLATYILRAWYYTAVDKPTADALLADPVTRPLLDWPGWWPLVVVLLAALVVLIGALARLARPRPRPVAAPGPVPIPAPPPPATAPVPVSPPRRESLSLSGAPVAPLQPGPGASLPPAPATTVVPVSRPADVTAVTPAQAPTSAPIAPAVDDGTKRCRTCGKELPAGAAFCTNCGTPVEG